MLCQVDAALRKTPAKSQAPGGWYFTAIKWDQSQPISPLGVLRSRLMWFIFEYFCAINMKVYYLRTQAYACSVDVKRIT